MSLVVVCLDCLEYRNTRDTAIVIEDDGDDRGDQLQDQLESPRDAMVQSQEIPFDPFGDLQTMDTELEMQMDTETVSAGWMRADFLDDLGAYVPDNNWIDDL